jgi:hypothetical protein
MERIIPKSFIHSENNNNNNNNNNNSNSGRFLVVVDVFFALAALTIANCWFMAVIACCGAKCVSAWCIKLWLPG